MNGIFGNFFDLNRDGELDTLEHALEFSLLASMMQEDEADSDCDDLNDFDGEDE